MYERFTDDARKVMQFSVEEAKRLGQSPVETEHILLGLVRNGRGVAAHTCESMQIDLRALGQAIEKLVAPNPPITKWGKLPQSLATKKVVEFAMEEARGFSHNYVGTEHLLLGLLREQVGMAAKVLVDAGAEIGKVRQRVRAILEER